MPSYDAERADPPAPFVSATIRHPLTKKSITDVPMLLDTGADATLVPRIVTEALGIASENVEGIRVVGFDGNASDIAPPTAASVEIHFLRKVFRGSFLLIDAHYGILGRDILNLLSLHFDGPRQTWREIPSSQD